HHDPGEAGVDSEGLDVLGYLVEVISGMPFAKFLKTRIFDRLGMEDTRVHLPQSKGDRLLPVQEKVDGKWRKFPVTNYAPHQPTKGATAFFGGGAGASSTANDYAAFLQMYLNQGELNGTRLLSRTTVQVILSDQIGDIWIGGKGYGLAFELVNQKGQDLGGEGSAGTFDWGGYFNTQYFADPQEQVIGIIMKQTQGDVKDETGWKFRQMVGAAVDD